MKKRNRIIGIILAAVLVLSTLSLFAACNGALTVTFDLNYEGAPAATVQNVNSGETATKPTPDPVREGYRFLGWYTAADNEVTYKFGQVNSNITVYAHWMQFFNITYDLNYAGAPDATVASYDTGMTSAQPTPPTRTNFTFNGWFTDSQCTSPYIFGQAVTSNMRLYAKWSITTFTVTLDPGYDTSSEEQTVEIGQKAIRPIEDPVRLGYDFVDWYTQAAGGEVYDFDTPITADNTVYARWTIQTFSVTFYLGYGDPVVSNFDYGQMIVLPNDPERSGYRFAGWCTDSAGNNPYTPAAVTGNLSIYAGWIDETVTTHTVTFNYNYTGAPGATTRQVQTGETVARPTPDPTRSGYSFGGWFTEAACTNAYNFSTAVTSGFTLYAKWTERYFDVTFDHNYTGAPAANVVQVQDGATVARPTPDPSRSGYSFGGWYTNAACTNVYNFSAAVTGNLTLFARWTLSGASTIYTFEAEYTPFNQEEEFPGYSGAERGTGVITEGAGDWNASNRYFVGWLYKEDATLTFTITSSAAVSNVTLTARLSAEFKSFTIGPEDDDGIDTGDLADDIFGYAFIVNDVALDYEPITFENVPTGGSPYAFRDFTVSTSVSLTAGVNVIKLVTFNSKAFIGGTSRAVAPLVDCIKLTTTANLTWDPRLDNKVW